MKIDIHPSVGIALYRCASCDTKWTLSSTKLDGKVEEFEGKEYPSVVLETCSGCHPFFTEKQTFIDTAGRVEKFQKRFAKFAKPVAAADDAKAPAAEATPAADDTKPATDDAKKPE
jgi:large subunit ribosomal protein L31